MFLHDRMLLSWFFYSIDFPRKKADITGLHPKDISQGQDGWKREIAA
ncbi:hypothetical protein L6R29_24430 [Myxococcota bacterium]|nr:hypothetical protein [Myxococcota bacterium]